MTNINNLNEIEIYGLMTETTVCTPMTPEQKSLAEWKQILLMLEATGINDSPNQSFADAIQEATENIAYFTSCSN